MARFLVPKITEKPKIIDSKRHHKIDQFLDRFFIDFRCVLEAKLDPCWPPFSATRLDSQQKSGNRAQKIDISNSNIYFVEDSETVRTATCWELGSHCEDLYMESTVRFDSVSRFSSSGSFQFWINFLLLYVFVFFCFFASA